MVLFVTGRCQNGCFYCPVSEERSNKNVVYANERPVHTEHDILEEARSMHALGTGITGGEPLLVLDRVLRYIRLLKRTFGASHHIHLYTSRSPSREILETLTIAGLDEIRFHPGQDRFPDIATSGFARSVQWAKELDLDVGFEIPSLAGAEQVAAFALGCDVFLNLNELEFSHSNTTAMKARGFTISDDVSCGALGSREVACDIMKVNPGLKFNYCSSRFKDAVQLRKRLQRTAQTRSREFDEITEDGTLFYGVIGGDIEQIMRFLTELEVPQDLYHADHDRVELGWWVLEDISPRIGDRFLSWYEERYPTYGQLIVEKIPVDSGEFYP